MSQFEVKGHLGANLIEMLISNKFLYLLKEKNGKTSTMND